MKRRDFIAALFLAPFARLFAGWRKPRESFIAEARFAYKVMPRQTIRFVGFYPNGAYWNPYLHIRQTGLCE